MPESTPLPVHACSPAPILHPDEDIPNKDLYGNALTEMEQIRRAAQKTYNPMGSSYRPPEKNATQAPFGAIMGFQTNLGPISFPKGPVKGYVRDPFYVDGYGLQHRWVLHATPPGVRRRGARGLRR